MGRLGIADISLSLCRGSVQTPLGLEGGARTSMHTLKSGFSKRSLIRCAVVIALIVQGDLAH